MYTKNQYNSAELLADIITVHRMITGMSLAEVAEIVGCNVQVLVDAESGDFRRMNRKTFAMLTTVLSLSRKQAVVANAVEFAD